MRVEGVQHHEQQQTPSDEQLGEKNKNKAQPPPPAGFGCAPTSRVPAPLAPEQPTTAAAPPPPQLAVEPVLRDYRFRIYPLAIDPRSEILSSKDR